MINMNTEHLSISILSIVSYKQRDIACKVANLSHLISLQLKLISSEFRSMFTSVRNSRMVYLTVGEQYWRVM